jgi:Xylose isomerase-like TIM barrel
MVDAIGRPAVRTMIDTCAAGRSERAPIPDPIERWLPTGKVTHIHLNDPNHRAPGQGDLRFGPILAALEAQRYAGICSVEPFVYEPDGPTCAARAIGHVEGLLEEPRPPDLRVGSCADSDTSGVSWPTASESGTEQDQQGQPDERGQVRREHLVPEVRQLGAYELVGRNLVSHFLGEGIDHSPSLTLRDSSLLPFLG